MIVPIRPTLRRLQQVANTDSFQTGNTIDNSNEGTLLLNKDT